MIGKKDATVAIIRSYNNRFVVKQVKNLLTIGVGRIIVVTNGPADKGATRGYLATLLDDSRVELVEMAEGYSWSNALNAGMKAMQMANIERSTADKTAFRFIFPVSVEARFTRSHLEKMLDAITDNAKTAVVGTSFAGSLDGSPVSLGRSYRHPRNTGMLIRVEAFKAIMGCFDPRCDSMGGMEDIAFLLELLALSDMRYEMVDLSVPLILGQHYDQVGKEVREQKAMDKIVAYWRSLYQTGSPQRERIDSAIATMGLDR